MSEFPSVCIEDIAADRRGAIKIGPFGSQLKKEEMVRDGIRVYGQENIISEDFSLGDRRISWSKFVSLSSCELYPGDVVMTMMGTVGRCSVFPSDAERGIMDSHLLRIQPDTGTMTSKYLAIALSSPSIIGPQISQLAHGSIMSGLSSRIVRQFRVPVPSIAEQRRIAEILDTADDAIRSTELLIAKLEQNKRGLLHDLLTCGTSGWSISNVESEFDVKPGITLGPGRTPRSHPKPYLRVANVQRDRIDTSDIAFLEASSSETIDYALAVGDLLVVEGHANAWEIGRCAIVAESQAGLLYQNHLFRLRSRKVSPEFGLLWLNSAFAQNYWWRMCATSSGLNTINSRQLRALPVPVPSAKEQARIVDLAAGTSSRLSAEQRQLDKLRLLNRGLMSDLLTGRVQVGASR